MTVVNMRALKRFWFNGMRDVNDQFDAHSRHARSLSAVGRGLYPGPSAFTFTDVTGAAPETVYVSNTITIAGLTVPTPLFIDGGGGSYSKNGGPYRSTPSTVVTGDTITVRLTSSADPETAVSAVVTIGGVGDTYTVTTTAGGGGTPEWLPEGAIAFVDFANEHYYAGGAERALADIFLDPGTVSLAGTLTHLPTIGVDGWGSTTPEAVQPTGALLSDLRSESAGRTIIFAVNLTEWEGIVFSWVIFASNEVDLDFSRALAGIGDWTGGGYLSDDTANGIGPHKVGVTIAPGAYSLFVDGRWAEDRIEVLGEPYSLSDGDHGFRIVHGIVTAIIVYAEKTPEEAQVLTTVA